MSHDEGHSFGWDQFFLVIWSGSFRKAAEMYVAEAKDTPSNTGVALPSEIPSIPGFRPALSLSRIES
jgi:hypothetical protein